MAYSDFTLPELTKRFNLVIDEQRDLFAGLPEITPSAFLQATLAENAPLALAIQTEKARSELIIAPILVEVRKLADRRISLFSGVDFSVDPADGLVGVCDYLFSQSPEQFFIRAPVLVVIEARNENIKQQIAQCGATLIAAQRFNERAGTGVTAVYGAVTTGNIWRFLQLSGTMLSIDRPEYYIDNLGAILAILLYMTTSQMPVNNQLEHLLHLELLRQRAAEIARGDYVTFEELEQTLAERQNYKQFPGRT